MHIVCRLHSKPIQPNGCPMARLPRVATLGAEEFLDGYVESARDALERGEGGVALARFDAVKRYAVEFEHECKLALRHAFLCAELGNAHTEFTPEFQIVSLLVVHA